MVVSKRQAATLPRVKVFISWSGEPSKQIALALRDWLPLVIQACKKKTYMSDKDNEAGILWGEKVSSELQSSDFGIVCLTPGNLESRWVYFEAGALSKIVGQARVVPLLHGLDTADVGLPLSRFHMKLLDEGGIKEVVRSMNSALNVEDQLEAPELARLFNAMWPDLKSQLDVLPTGGPAARKRPDRELLEEILELVRANIGFINATPSASGPGSFSGVGLSPERILAKRNTIGNEFFQAPAAVVPPKIIERLRRIAGPNGLVSTDFAAITIQSPRVGTDDFTTEEKMFLDTTREFLEAMGMKLNFVDVRRDTPSES